MSAGGDAPELSVVIPCLDEAETLATVIREARAALDRAGIRGEIVVGDNGSTDGSQEIARHEGARVVDITERGYGSAVMGAIARSRGRYVVMGDADASYDFEAIPAFLTMVMMPLTVSITEGIAFGLIAYAVLKLCTGRGREVHALVYVCAALFVARYVWLV